MNTILTIVLGALGIIATVVVTWYFTKKQTKNKEITHFSISSYDIGKGLSDDFPEFQLQFNGDNLVGDVKVLKGYFINTGNKDVAGLDEKPIQLILPDGCKVKASNVSGVSNGFDVNTNISDLGIDFIISDGVLKTKDFFEYTAIVETPRGMGSLQEDIKIGPRRENLDYKYIFPGSEEKPIYKWPVVRIFLAGLVVLTIITLAALFSLPRPLQHKIIDKNTNKEVSIYVNRHSDIFLVDDGHDLSLFANQTITEDQLNNNYVLYPQIGSSAIKPFVYLWIVGIYTVLSFLWYALYVCYILFWRKRKRIIRILHNNKK